MCVCVCVCVQACVKSVVVWPTFPRSRVYTQLKFQTCRESVSSARDQSRKEKRSHLKQFLSSAWHGVYSLS